MLLIFILGMNFGSQILIINAVEFFAGLNNTCISDRTMVLLLLDVIIVYKLKFFGFLFCTTKMNQQN